MGQVHNKVGRCRESRGTTVSTWPGLLGVHIGKAMRRWSPGPGRAKKSFRECRYAAGQNTTSCALTHVPLKGRAIGTRKAKCSNQNLEEKPPTSCSVLAAPSIDKAYITFNVQEKSLGSGPLWQSRY